MQSLSCPPPPPPPVVRSGIPAQTSIPLPVYCHSAEATYGTYRYTTFFKVLVWNLIIDCPF
jgi:hypothetical protein